MEAKPGENRCCMGWGPHLTSSFIHLGCHCKQQEGTHTGIGILCDDRYWHTHGHPQQQQITLVIEGPELLDPNTMTFLSRHGDNGAWSQCCHVFAFGPLVLKLGIVPSLWSWYELADLCSCL